MHSFFPKILVILFLGSSTLTACSLMTPEYSQAAKCKGASCDEIRELELIKAEDQLAFAGKNGYIRLMRLYIHNKEFAKAIELQRQTNLNHIAPRDHEQYEVLVWMAHAGLIPEKTDRCAPNPLTRTCDEGDGTGFAIQSFYQRYPESIYTEDMQRVEKAYYHYRVSHQAIKYQYYVEDYEGAVRPQGLISKLIVNHMRGNNKRTDGKVYANCVGPREDLPGKCDLVGKHVLLRRIIQGGEYLLDIMGQHPDRAELEKEIAQYKEELAAIPESLIAND